MSYYKIFVNYYKKFFYYMTHGCDSMAEWLRRQIRNLVGFARGVRIPLLSYDVYHTLHAWMAEWSKAVDLSSILFVGVGSNPTSGIPCVMEKKFFAM